MLVPQRAVIELQIYLGSLFVNQVNLFGRTWRVYIQAEPEFRATTDGISQMYTRTADGLMVPLSTITVVGETTGPDTIIRYNLYRTAEITGGAAPGYSSDQAISLMEQIAREALPHEVLLGEGYSLASSSITLPMT